MSLSEMLLPEFDQEMSTTRKTLERVPEDKFGWKPHEKSSAMGGLATHLANIPTWTVHTLGKDELDIAPPGAPPARPEELKTRSELLEKFDQNVKEARDAVSAASDERWYGSWSLLLGGKTLLTMPRAVVMRSFVMSHMIHHRAQLGVYLRLNDVPVPSVYGPSADENPF